MSAPKHTPGPWVLVQYAKGINLPIPFMEHKTTAVFADGVKGGDVAYMQHGLYGDDQALVNALLIAAAPEMLAALQNVRDARRTGHNADEAWRWVDAAITKATGDDK